MRTGAPSMESRGYAEPGLFYSMRRRGCDLPVEADGMFPLDPQRAAEEEQRQRGHKSRVVHVHLRHSTVGDSSYFFGLKYVIG